MKNKTAAGGGRGGLSAQDQALWLRLARTVRPLFAGKARAQASLKENSPANVPAAGRAAAAAKPRPKPPGAPALPQKAAAAATAAKRFDRGLYRRLAQGKLAVAARLDLHEHSQAEAYQALLYSVRQAQQGGRHYILVITGKGRSGDESGVLQRQVPHWLATAPFRPYIAGVEQAARRHGGAGAFYVHIRRRAAAPLL